MRFLKKERGSTVTIMVLGLTLVGVLAVSALTISINMSKSAINSANRARDQLQVREKQVEDTEKQVFNSRFTIYVGETTNTNSIKNLQQSIKASNAVNTDHTVKYTGPESIKTTGKYGVNIKYDNDGYVCEVIVTEIK